MDRPRYILVDKVELTGTCYVPKRIQKEGFTPSVYSGWHNSTPFRVLGENADAINSIAPAWRQGEVIHNDRDSYAVVLGTFAGTSCNWRNPTPEYNGHFETDTLYSGHYDLTGMHLTGDVEIKALVIIVLDILSPMTTANQTKINDLDVDRPRYILGDKIELTGTCFLPERISERGEVIPSVYSGRHDNFIFRVLGKNAEIINSLAPAWRQGKVIHEDRGAHVVVLGTYPGTSCSWRNPTSEYYGHYVLTGTHLTGIEEFEPLRVINFLAFFYPLTATAQRIRMLSLMNKANQTQTNDIDMNRAWYILGDKIELTWTCYLSERISERGEVVWSVYSGRNDDGFLFRVLGENADAINSIAPAWRQDEVIHEDRGGQVVVLGTKVGTRCRWRNPTLESYGQYALTATHLTGEVEIKTPRIYPVLYFMSRTLPTVMVYHDDLDMYVLDDKLELTGTCYFREHFNARNKLVPSAYSGRHDNFLFRVLGEKADAINSIAPAWRQDEVIHKDRRGQVVVLGTFAGTSCNWHYSTSEYYGHYALTCTHLTGDVEIETQRGVIKFQLKQP
jgi:hypothetical protein